MPRAGALAARLALEFEADAFPGGGEKLLSKSAREPGSRRLRPMADYGSSELGDVLGQLAERVEQMARVQDSNFAATQKQLTEMKMSLDKLEFENRMLRKRLGNFKGESLPDALRKQTSEVKDMPTLVKHLETIHKLMNSAEKGAPLEHAFFLSHYQAEAGDIAGVMDLQMKIRGYKCWYDQDATHITQEGMLQGIRSSAVFMLILTKGVFRRPWCLFEIRSAMHLGKPIQMLHEAETNRASYASLQEIIASAPEDMQILFQENESLPFRRKVYEQQALLDRLLLSWSDPLEELVSERLARCGAGASERADEAPSVLANGEMAKIVHGGRKTATLYIDLGTGQIAFKLLALSADGHLAYEDLLTISFNLVSGRPALGSPECKEVEKQIRDAVADGREYVMSHVLAGESLEERFTGVRCGATQWYRDLDERARVQKAEPALAWLRNVVLSALPQKTPYDFEELTGTEEASLEWISVKNAMQAEFASEPPMLSLSGGKGSVQTSCEGGGGHGADHLSARVPLGEGTQRLTESSDAPAAVDAWRARVKDAVAQPFEPMRNRIARSHPPGGRNKNKELRMICSSGFFYIAVAANVIGRKDPPKYLAYEADVRPRVMKLVNDPAAKAMDRANGVRFLKCLDYLLSDDPSHVKLLFAREWLVRKQPYRVTWSTGAFIQYLAERYYTITGEADDAHK